ncbi:hypothetical protein C8R45DRAFT_1106751 [Mycena sanguinolenta]|nr:hypothetical protein C8R45DRAFT_1106751 [Mycena sanguinolenta]
MWTFGSVLVTLSDKAPGRRLAETLRHAREGQRHERQGGDRDLKDVDDTDSGADELLATAKELYRSWGGEYPDGDSIIGSMLGRYFGHDPPDPAPAGGCQGKQPVNNSHNAASMEGRQPSTSTVLTVGVLAVAVPYYTSSHPHFEGKTGHFWDAGHALGMRWTPPGARAQTPCAGCIASARRRRGQRLLFHQSHPIDRRVVSVRASSLGSGGPHVRDVALTSSESLIRKFASSPVRLLAPLIASRPQRGRPCTLDRLAGISGKSARRASRTNLSVTPAFGR